LLVFHTQESERLYLDQIYGYRLYMQDLILHFCLSKYILCLFNRGLQWLGCKKHVSFVYFLFDRQSMQFTHV